MKPSPKQQEYMDLEARYGAHNYKPLPVVLNKGKGTKVFDVDGNEYYDFLSAYSAVNQGHCHQKIVDALVDQANTLCLTSRAFYNDCLGEYEKYVTDLFGYDKLLPMNSGAEAVETAKKLARKWAYEVKGVAPDQAKIVCCEDNFHGRTISIVSMSTDPDAYGNFGPFVPGIIKIPYNDVEALEKVLQEDGEEVCAFLVEPIQGEAGVVVPDEGYLTACYDLCKKHNVLFVADEVQTGIARTGKMLACEHEGVRPDIVILGKALSGGVFPVSAVLADDDIMMTIRPGQHGSTYGGNPIACKVGMAALQVVIDEDLCERATVLGERFRQGLLDMNDENIELVRGKGLLNAAVIRAHDGKEAWDLCLLMAKYGVLAKQTHQHIVRFAPPLVITEEELDDALERIKRAFAEYAKK
ncbi:MAG TPA: ornithine--oxo-acid transaminase [Fastidiosipila sp.]|nr:ornithine--oxo-acid transaminase [Fastidiosipila sp.]